MAEGRNILITGSSRGIGLAIARRLGHAGNRVVLNCSSSDEALAQAVAALKAEGICAAGLCADVSDYAQSQKLAAFARAQFGAVDVLINNAGSAYYGLFTEMAPMQWQAVMAANLYSVYNCCHQLVPEMVRRKSGRIINISSVWGESGASCEAVYSAAKGAVNTFTKALAKELAPSGVLVNAISCGVIDTKMNSGLSTEERAALCEEIPLGRFGTPEEVADLCAYLADADYMTGQLLRLDGGFLD